eukprot:893836-Amphidinium_carterae.1
MVDAFLHAFCGAGAFNTSSDALEHNAADVGAVFLASDGAHGLHAEQPRADEDEMAQVREENAKVFRVASEFMKGDVYEQVMLLAVPLEAERKLMDVIVHSIGRHWEERQLQSVWQTGKRAYRILQHFE